MKTEAIFAKCFCNHKVQPAKYRLFVSTLPSLFRNPMSLGHPTTVSKAAFESPQLGSLVKKVLLPVSRTESRAASPVRESAYDFTLSQNIVIRVLGDLGLPFRGGYLESTSDSRWQISPFPCV